MIATVLRGTALAVLAVPGIANATNATEVAEAQASIAGGDDIIVSAKTGDQTLHDYAGSAAVFDATALVERHVEDLTTLSFGAPNVSLDTVGTFRGVANFAIRGLGVNSSIPSIDPAVGLFVDGVYMGINAGTVFDTLDLADVQVLRGPQGVTLGRNTTGGAVLVTTGNPTWDWQGSVQMNVETPVDGGRGKPMGTMRGVVSGPLSDTLAVRIAALHSIDGGYFHNDFTGQAFGENQATAVRGSLLWRASERLTITAKGEYSRGDGDGAPGHNNGLFPRDSFALAIDEEGFYHSRGKSAVVRGEYALDNGVITSISGWRSYDLRTRNDIDSSPRAIFHSDTATRQRQWSQELFYRATHGPVTTLLGAYYFHQRQGYEEDRNMIGFGLPKQYGGGDQRHDVYALYANADWQLTEALTASLGLRWSREEKDVAVTYVRERAQCSAIAGTCPVTGQRVPGENNGFTDGRSWNALSPRIALAYAFTPAINGYVSWTRGQRSGGYNLRITQPSAFEDVAARTGSPAFDAEQVDAFEAGLKWQSADGRARIHAAGFWMNVGDMQREVSVASATSGLAQSVYNTADARIRGGEVEAQFALTPHVSITANAGYIDADYRHVVYDISGDGAITGADAALALPRVPKWTYGIGAALNVPMGGATLNARADFQHRDRYAYTDSNYGWVDAFDSLDASIGVTLDNPAIRISLYGRNLLDQVQFGGDTQLAFAGGPNSSGVAIPFGERPAAGTFSPLMKGRRIGVEVGMAF